MKKGELAKIYEVLKEKLLWLMMWCVFVVMAIWSWLTPIWVDDWRSIIDGRPMQLGQIIQTQITGYQVWSGRIFGEGISRLLVVMPRPIFGILNGLVFLALSVLMLKLTTNQLSSKKSTIINYSFILISLFLLTPDFGQVYLWTSGSGNYLWTTVINLLFIYLFFNFEKFNLNHLSRILIYLILIPVAIVAGWSNETTGGGVLIFILGTVGLHALQSHKIKINYQKIVLLLIYFISYVFLLKAPGNKVRANTLNADFIHKSFFDKLSIRVPQVNDFIETYLLWILVVFVALLVINFFLVKNQAIIKSSLLWLVSGFAMIYALVFSPALDVTAHRIFFTGFIFIIIGMINLIPREFDNLNLKMLLSFSLITLSLLTILKVSTGFIDSEKTNIAIQHRYEFISREKERLGNKKTIYVPPLEYIGNTKYSVDYGTMWDLVRTQNDNQFIYPNSEYEIMYGVKRILLK